MTEVSALEGERLAALAACKVMDTEREPAFDRIVFTAAQLLRVPMAMITLVSQDRAWAKAKVGPVAQERSRANSFSGAAIQSAEPLVLEDASLNDRFKVAARLTNEELVRFVISIPLLGPRALPIGALTVCCTHPRMNPGYRLHSLVELARHAEELLCIRAPDIDVTLR